MSWVPVLCAAFVEAAPEARGPLGEALAAYACICAPDVVAGFFRTAVQKLIKVPCCFWLKNTIWDLLQICDQESHVLFTETICTDSKLMRGKALPERHS
jgi:hypothetical protein